MSATKHTPGPWECDMDLDETGLEVWAVGSRRINATKVATPLICRVVDHCIDGQSAKATAHLIAAAPELLEALSIIANALSPNSLPVNGMMASYDHAPMVREEADRAFEVARAAIAKATQP